LISEALVLKQPSITGVAAQILTSKYIWRFHQITSFLYGESYLNFGKDLAQDNIIRAIVKETPDVKEIKFPCFFKGYKKPWSVDQNISIEGTSDP
jgi:hypothetical protein